MILSDFVLDQTPLRSPPPSLDTLTHPLWIVLNLEKVLVPTYFSILVHAYHRLPRNKVWSPYLAPRQNSLLGLKQQRNLLGSLVSSRIFLQNLRTSPSFVAIIAVLLPYLRTIFSDLVPNIFTHVNPSSPRWSRVVNVLFVTFLPTICSLTH